MEHCKRDGLSVFPHPLAGRAYPAYTPLNKRVPKQARIYRREDKWARRATTSKGNRRPTVELGQSNRRWDQRCCSSR